MTPYVTLNLAIPDAPRDLVGLEMPAPTHVVEHALLLPDDDPAPLLVEVLHYIMARLEDRRADDDVAVAVANCNTELRGGHGHAAGEHGLCLQRLREVYDPARAAVDPGQWRLDH